MNYNVKLLLCWTPSSWSSNWAHLYIYSPSHSFIFWALRTVRASSTSLLFSCLPLAVLSSLHHSLQEQHSPLIKNKCLAGSLRSSRREKIVMQPHHLSVRLEVYFLYTFFFMKAFFVTSLFQMALLQWHSFPPMAGRLKTTEIEIRIGKWNSRNDSSRREI